MNVQKKTSRLSRVRARALVEPSYYRGTDGSVVTLDVPAAAAELAENGLVVDDLEQVADRLRRGANLRGTFWWDPPDPHYAPFQGGALRGWWAGLGTPKVRRAAEILGRHLDVQRPERSRGSSSRGMLVDMLVEIVDRKAP